MAKGKAKSKARKRVMKKRRRQKERAMRFTSKVFIVMFVILLLVAGYCSWLLTVEDSTVECWLATEITTTLYFAFGTTGLVTILTRKAPKSDEKIWCSWVKSAGLMILSFVTMGLLQQCENPYLRWIAYMLQIPLNLGISWFFALLGHYVDSLGKNLDYDKLEKNFR